MLNQEESDADDSHCNDHRLQHRHRHRMATVWKGWRCSIKYERIELICIIIDGVSANAIDPWLLITSQYGTGVRTCLTVDRSINTPPKQPTSHSDSDIILHDMTKSVYTE